MADERLRRNRMLLVMAFLAAYALALAEAGTAAWSLVSGERWSWDHFSWFFFLASASTVASSLGQSLARRGALGSMNPQAQRKYDEGTETAKAVRTGVLPPEADPHRWRPRIRRHVRQAVVIGTCSTVLCVTAAVLTATAAHLNNDDDPVLWTLAVVALLVLVPVYLLVIRTRRRGGRLLALL